MIRLLKWFFEPGRYSVGILFLALGIAGVWQASIQHAAAEPVKAKSDVNKYEVVDSTHTDDATKVGRVSLKDVKAGLPFAELLDVSPPDARCHGQLARVGSEIGAAEALGGTLKAGTSLDLLGGCAVVLSIHPVIGDTAPGDGQAADRYAVVLLVPANRQAFIGSLETLPFTPRR